MRLINSRRSRGGIVIDEFEIEAGGGLLAPLVVPWSIEARRQALGEGKRPQQRADEPPPAP